MIDVLLGIEEIWWPFIIDVICTQGSYLPKQLILWRLTFNRRHLHSRFLPAKNSWFCDVWRSIDVVCTQRSYLPKQLILWRLTFNRRHLHSRFLPAKNSWFCDVWRSILTSFALKFPTCQNSWFCELDLLRWHPGEPSTWYHCLYASATTSEENYTSSTVPFDLSSGWKGRVSNCSIVATVWNRGLITVWFRNFSGNLTKLFC